MKALLLASLLVLCFASEGQSLFRELFAPGSPAEFNIRHQQSTSNWRSPYGRLSKTDVDIFSKRFMCPEKEGCHFRLHAGHELQRFGHAGRFGDRLENPKFGAMVDIKSRRRFLGELTFSSPSDLPFGSIHETNINFFGAMAPNEELRTFKDPYWLYFLHYSNTRTFLPNIPLPGFTYMIPTKSGWLFSIGAPILSATYVDFPRLNFRATLGPYLYSAELGYGPPFLMYGISSSWRQDSYFISTRTQRDERFFLDQKEVSLFFRHPLSKQLLLEWKAIYFYDLGIRHGQSYSRRTAPTEDLGTAAAITVNLKVRLDSPRNR